MSKEKDKGYRNEVKIVDWHTEAGVLAERVPFSGSAGHLRDDLQHDVRVLRGALVGEVKSRKSDTGFRVIKGWLGTADLLYIVENRRAPLVVMHWATYEKLIQAYQKEVNGAKQDEQ